MKERWKSERSERRADAIKLSNHQLGPVLVTRHPWYTMTQSIDSIATNHS